MRVTGGGTPIQHESTLKPQSRSFTVEIKNQRRPNQSSPSRPGWASESDLGQGRFDKAEPESRPSHSAARDQADRLFGSLWTEPSSKTVGDNGDPAPAMEGLPAKASQRILPSLTPDRAMTEPGADTEKPSRPRKPATRKAKSSPSPQAIEDLAEVDGPIAAVAEDNARRADQRPATPPAAAARPRARSGWAKKANVLGPGEKWKARLPKALRRTR